MKKIMLIFTVLLFAIAGFSQATKKDHIEIYSLTKPLGINIPAGSLCYRADSNFWIVCDSAFSKADSGATIVRQGGTYFRVLYDDNYLKYALTADTTSTKLRNGSVRLTTKYIWIKVNGTWKKIAWE